MNEYVEEDPAELAFYEAATRIQQRWIEAFPSEAHLAHSILGSWQCFWLAFDLRSPLELLRDDDASAIRKNANDFLESGFGERRGPTLNEPAPECLPAGLL